MTTVAGRSIQMRTALKRNSPTQNVPRMQVRQSLRISYRLSQKITFEFAATAVLSSCYTLGIYGLYFTRGRQSGRHLCILLFFLAS